MAILKWWKDIDQSELSITEGKYVLLFDLRVFCWTEIFASVLKMVHCPGIQASKLFNDNIFKSYVTVANINY